MSNQSYRKNCMYCNQEILMDINGNSKWAAYNVNGEFHSCNQMPGTQKKIVDKPLNIEERLARLERIVLDPRK